MKEDGAYADTFARNRLKVRNPLAYTKSRLVELKRKLESDEDFGVAWTKEQIMEQLTIPPCDELT